LGSLSAHGVPALSFAALSTPRPYADFPRRETDGNCAQRIRRACLD